MNPQIIIPARFASSRFPGKPLHMIGRRPLIEHTWRAAMRTGWPVLIATDDEEIAAVAVDFGASVQMTDECANGTERCAQAYRRAGLTADIVINWQGDSPLCPPAWAHALVEELREGAASVATPVQRCDQMMIRKMRADIERGIIGATTAVLASSGNALYFSKAIVPPKGPWFFHVGLYAYWANALRDYGRTVCDLERSEGLEQLRFLDLGIAIKAVQVSDDPVWEVNNPGDVQEVSTLLQRLNETA